MKTELFETVWAALQKVSIDNWKIQTYNSSRRLYLKHDGVIIDLDGDLKVDCAWQTLSFFQKRRIKKHFYHLKEEIATRAVQRKFNLA